MRLFERLDQFEGRSKLGTWLYRIAYNLCQDILRERKPISPLILDYDDDDTQPIPTILIDWDQVPEHCVTAAEINMELDRAINTLPTKLKAVFLLREVEGLSTQESADVLDISISAAKVRLHRARLLLREQLAKYFAELVA